MLCKEWVIDPQRGQDFDWGYLNILIMGSCKDFFGAFNLCLGGHLGLRYSQLRYLSELHFEGKPAEG